MDEGIMYGWRREVKRLEKQVKCSHPAIMPDATGRAGLCMQCGKTVRLMEGA